MPILQMGNGRLERSSEWPCFTLADSGSEFEHVYCCLVDLLRNARKWRESRKHKEGTKTEKNY